jgi:hypothetical protein
MNFVFGLICLIASLVVVGYFISLFIRGMEIERESQKRRNEFAERIIKHEKT